MSKKPHANQTNEINKKEFTYTSPEALKFHKDGIPGKVGILPTKPLISQRDLALAYSPGVAAPCIEIYKDADAAYDYTAKSNFVAVISNGTAVLGLGNLGALASKPVMEGKAVLFKRFADIDAIDIEVDTEEVDEFVNAVKYLGPSWGGINLEDIKSPECFIIEEKLKEIMDIPVFHDDQHGTAIIATAGLINAAHLTGKKLEDLKFVLLGAGAAGIACIDLIKEVGVKHALLVDRVGVIYKGRKESMNQWKEKFAYDTKDRTLEDAIRGADVFMGLSEKGAITKAMVKTMAKNPLIFAMANPDPEITPEEVKEVRDDAIIATGRSDYNNQVNNVLGFPYIFRGALDVRAKAINQEMKIAAARAIARLARQPVPEEVAKAYGGKRKVFGPEYIIPSPFDPRLIAEVSSAVAKAAMETGVARKRIEDMEAYKEHLSAKLNPALNVLQLINKQLVENPKTLVFAEGEEESSIRAALQWVENQYGKAILVGREPEIRQVLKEIGVSDAAGLKIVNSWKDEQNNERYIEHLYNKLNRKGFIKRDLRRLVKNDRNYYASCMLELGEADLMVTGLTRTFNESIGAVMKVVDTKASQRIIGISIFISPKGQTIFLADTAMHCDTDAKSLALIAKQTAAFAEIFGQEPRVAFLTYSNFGNPKHKDLPKIQEAVKILEKEKVSFEFDGDLTAEVALNASLMELYPFCRLSKPANILIMPNLNSAHIASKLLAELGGGTIIGPVLIGFDKAVQVVPFKSGASDILNISAISSAFYNRG
ncbi:MAG: NADP-dependent malic enzyme [Alphaproteobacteria bacterium]|jgi:malate dehydrogenase (oxaloacetate-decarboxylating)(NADP+)